jgi:peptide deformylase
MPGTWAGSSASCCGVGERGSVTVRPIRLLGDPRLYEPSVPVARDELAGVEALVADLHDTLFDFRQRYGAGRAIAAPQIGVMKRLIYVHIDRPVVLINPVLDRLSQETMAVWDDCMCFPQLLVRVMRHESCRITYRNQDWQAIQWELRGDLSELLQHEYDHLDGVLAVAKAIDGRSFALRSQRALLT